MIPVKKTESDKAVKTIRQQLLASKARHLRERQLSLFEQTGVPITPKHTAPMNNYLARSSLFSPLKRGKRQMHHNSVLYQDQNIEITRTGPALDMADHGVFLESLRRAAGTKPFDLESGGEPPSEAKVLINRADFLHALGKNSSGKNYQWLQASFGRLFATSLAIKHEGITNYLHLLSNLNYDEHCGDYYYIVPRTSFILFANQQYGFVNMLRRRELSNRISMAQWLQSYISSHNKEHENRIGLGKLREMCGYSGQLRDFRVAVKEALQELIRVHELRSAHVDERDIVHWLRADPKTKE